MAAIEQTMTYNTKDSYLIDRMVIPLEIEVEIGF